MNGRKTLKTQIKPIVQESCGIVMEYAHPGAPCFDRQSAPDWNRERERLKEQLLPFLKETVKKQLKEEREYYKSRPSLAAKQLEAVLGTGGVEKILVSAAVERVYERIEQQLRLERMRKGR